MKFNIGSKYNTLKPMGLALKADGSVQLSQKIDQNGGSNVLPTEDLTFVGRENGKSMFKRLDGSMIVGHISHFDPEHGYNKGTKQKTTEELKAEVKKAADAKSVQLSELEIALNSLENINVDNYETSSDDSPDTLIENQISDDDRDEAESIFNDA